MNKLFSVFAVSAAAGVLALSAPCAEAWGGPWGGSMFGMDMGQSGGFPGYYGAPGTQGGWGGPWGGNMFGMDMGQSSGYRSYYGVPYPTPDGTASGNGTPTLGND